jgi:hypothetical protein
MFAVVSDTHISDHIWKYRPDVYGDSYYSWKQICLACATAKINLVVAGDIFDGAVSSSDARAFRDGLDLMERAGCTLFYIRGQHDFVDRFPGWAAALSSGICKEVNNKAFEPVPGCVMFGLDHLTSTPAINAALATVPNGVQALLMHQLLKLNDDSRGGPLLDPDKVPAHVSHVFLGDHHAAVEHKLNGKMFYYGGSTHLRSINEPAEKSYMLVNTSSKVQGVITAVSRVPLKTRPMFRLSISDEANLQQVLQAIGTEITWNRLLGYMGWSTRPDDKDPIRKSVVRPIIKYEYPAAMPNPGNLLRQSIDASINPVLFGMPKIDASLEGSTSYVELPTDITSEALTSVLAKYSKPETEDARFITDLLTKSTEDIIKTWELA